jgi:cytochrome c551/c552
MKKLAVMVALLVGFALPIESVDAAKYNKFKVKRIITKSKCFKCHAITREKVGPAYIRVSQRFNEDPDGRQKIYTHLTTSPEIEVEGKKENHVNLKSGGDKEINEVITWLLSLQDEPKYKKYLTKTTPTEGSASGETSASASAPAKASTPASPPAKASAPASAPAKASAPASTPAKASAPSSAPAKASASSSTSDGTSSSSGASGNEDASSSSSDDGDTSWFEQLFESR